MRDASNEFMFLQTFEVVVCHKQCFNIYMIFLNESQQIMAVLLNRI